MKPYTYKEITAYGLFGFPLALVALPIYIYVPMFYAQRFGMSLTLIGGALLITRLLDAFIDPAIGLWIDRSQTGYHRCIVWSLPFLLAGFIALFHPPQISKQYAFFWFLFSLMVVYAGFSLATIAYQSWGAALTQARAHRSRVSATREGFGLVGVIIAATLQGFTNVGWLSWIFVGSLLTATLVLLKYAPRPVLSLLPAPIAAGWLTPFGNPLFRSLFAVFMVNGIAAAIPATLFLFFVKDRLAMPQYAGMFLTFYFIAAFLSMPLWVYLSKRHGEKNIWLIAMALAVSSFTWAYTLSAGEVMAYASICIISGAALGADLALPAALLAAVIHHANDSGAHEGVYFGAWNWATKMNLALAAGIVLPVLGLAGYSSGSSQPNALLMLALAYALLPGALKTLAALLLWRAPLNQI